MCILCNCLAVYLRNCVKWRICKTVLLILSSHTNAVISITVYCVVTVECKCPERFYSHGLQVPEYKKSVRRPGRQALAWREVSPSWKGEITLLCRASQCRNHTIVQSIRQNFWISSTICFLSVFKETKKSFLLLFGFCGYFGATHSHVCSRLHRTMYIYKVLFL